jgi:hypothetical protein
LVVAAIEAFDMVRLKDNCCVPRHIHCRNRQRDSAFVEHVCESRLAELGVQRSSKSGFPASIAKASCPQHGAQAGNRPQVLTRKNTMAMCFV